MTKLRNKNIVSMVENQYFLQVSTLQSMTNNIREEVNAMLDDIEAVGKEIDDVLNL